MVRKYSRQDGISTMIRYSRFFVLMVFLSPAFSSGNAEEKTSDSLVVFLKNPLASPRVDEAVSIDFGSILRKFTYIDRAGCAVYEAGAELPSQIDDTDGDGRPDLLTIIANFSPHETKMIVLKNRHAGSRHTEFKKRTQAELSVKVDYKYVGGKYTKGKFTNIDAIRVPDTHVDHDALFRYEGPGWESDKVGYRFYLDARNRTDIFGKKVPEMVLQTVGVNDLVADNNESYQSMMSWGMDIFKVGTSLGIGSIAMLNGKDVVTVSKTDSVICTIAANGPVRSDVHASYFGWAAGGKSYRLTSDYSITAGSRLTKHVAVITPLSENLCTGLAKHEGTTLLEPKAGSNAGWKYLALYGKQARSDDDLGIAVFYKGSDLIERREDEASHLAVLHPGGGTLTYYFAAAWVQEPGGIRTIDEFRSYLESESLKLDYPIEVSY